MGGSDGKEKEVLREVAKSVFIGDKDATLKAVRRAIDSNIRPEEILDKALIPGIRKAGDLYEKGQYFLPELIMCADAMKAAFGILRPLIEQNGEKVRTHGRVLIGTVEGDIHDIGKTLVGVMLSTSGFEVIDLGADVPLHRFVEEAVKNDVDIIGVSALLTTTMVKQKELIELLVKENLRERFKVIVGGAPVTQKWADDIGADGYGQNAVEAVSVAKKLVGVEE
ncbi:MAG: dimethylamine corrinoid protein 3 [Candidatus Neomarinimicrobiota bacterium]|nr:corrinoid protein [Candidatus Neomarinimicrobiota bacterium]RKY53569.1 MAG: dimethylamine corrinoid protein 3 [Candidatus Neomarinimicrobiota bacterium]